MKTITLKVEYDQDCENPLESCDGMWTLYEDRDVEQFFEERGGRYIPTSVAFFFKLRAGLAFMLDGSKDNYGYCGYHVRDFDPDARRLNAVLVWEEPVENIGATTYEDRKKDAQSTIKLYATWYSGECFGWIINDDQSDEDSCWGFVGEEHLIESLKHDYLPDERPLRIVLHGEHTKEIVGHTLEGEGIEVMTMREFEQWNDDQDAIEDGSEWEGVA